ncbi:MAG: DEAD/DEAH box helicase [Solirubrobacteraceae bacterium]|nr:DEAD/DEAH box helicase [Solirubrobacteraceae bacterium]
MTAFADLGLSDDVLGALREIGYERPSPIQEQGIPPMLEGRDVIGQAQTGSGKTCAFGAPIVQYVDVSNPETQALVLTPTRELCIQVTQAVRSFGVKKGVDVVATFGGAPIRDQISMLRKSAHVVVGTVGRVLDLIDRGALQLGSCRFVVLDEADEMLDLGFLEDVEKILRRTPNSRQTALFSATMAPPIRKLADNFLYEPVHVKVKADTLTVDTVEQFRVEVSPKDKPEKLAEVIAAERPRQAIVFCRTKIGTDRLYRLLRDRGNNVKALHGDLSQGQRDGVMLSFKGGRVPLLVATDVAARGLDISTVTHVVNYDVPRSPDTYVHRIGRTGRAGASGRAITFVEPKQQREREAIEEHIGMAMTEWAPGATTKAARRGSDDARPADDRGTDDATAGRDDDAPVVREKPRRGRKPQISRASDEAGARIVLVPGAADGVTIRALVRGITAATGLDGEAVREVLVLERFALATVPAAAVDDAVAAINADDATDLPLRAAVL